MSFDALAWAAKQRPGNLASKMVLLALANFANEQCEAYPSTAAIADFGDMNHKTATAALDRLESLGLISDTGDRRGKSGQIKVYRLHLETIPKTEASQKRKPPVSAAKASQKRVTDTVREPVSSEAKASSDSRVVVRQDFADQVVSDWNREIAGSPLSPAKRMTPARRKALTARVREHGEDAVLVAIRGMVGSDFHSGRNGKWTEGDLGWLLKPESFTKMLERASRDEAAKPERKPSVAGGDLFRRLQAGEISREEFDRERAEALRRKSGEIAHNPMVRAVLDAQARRDGREGMESGDL